ncbi:ImmA/IrrE family metallo-endopeptidase [Sphingomonas taxi]|uniref:ImmA/IrrE family metallo-endopeptidase n=1 Tax=Sphingomonas taxi TaxID=1549858 RepID=UPI0009DCDB57|nr:ImmA/IrrE family metallo-endopeptidase [Sphingomonas taxi]
MKKVRILTEYSHIERIPAQDLEVLERFSSDVPVKVGALADALGLKVVVATLPMNISGLIQPEADGQFVIKVNRFESKERQRFTIAHEIAHYLIHREKIDAGVVDSVLYRSKLSSRTEAEANRLAADIVMPRRAIAEAVRSKGEIQSDRVVQELASAFGVSKQAMAIRVG